MVCSEVTLQTYVPPRAEDTGLQSTVKTIFHMTNISRVGGKKKEKRTNKKNKTRNQAKTHYKSVLKSLFHSIKPV